MAKLKPQGEAPQKPSVLTNGPAQTSTGQYTVTVENECGVIQPNALVKASAFKPVPNSGGHDHDDINRPKGKLPPALDQTEQNTGLNGVLTVTYTAPEVSGKTLLTLECSIPSTTTTPAIQCASNNQFIEVAVSPRLVPLEAGDYYDLIGSYGMPWVTSMHNNNHGVTGSFRQKLQKLAEFYFLRYGAKLAYNDISLENGGLFDVRNNWKPSHHEHRIGISADLRLVPVNRRQELLKMVQKAGIIGATKFEDDKNHWHIREYGNNQ